MPSRQIGRGGRGDLQRCSIRPEENHHAVEPTNHAESAFVNGTVMATAQQEQDVEARRTAVGPMDHVMSVATLGRAAGESAAGVTRSESPAD